MSKDDDWYYYLPLTMLALRSQIKEDLDSTTSEVVYGTQLRLPGEFFEKNQCTKHVSSKFINAQQKFLSRFKYHESRFPTTRTTYVDPHLNKCRHVFIRNDATRTPLQPTYDGPFKVLHRTPKYFKVLKNTKVYTVSVDRLKAANLISDFLLEDDDLVTNEPSISDNDHTFPKLPSRQSKSLLNPRKAQPHPTTRTRTRRIKPPQRFQDYELM